MSDLESLRHRITELERDCRALVQLAAKQVALGGIPIEIDSLQMIDDLNRWGWSDRGIEKSCGYSRFYVGQVRCGNVRMMSYQRAARLFNLWESAAYTRLLRPSADLPIRTVEATTA